MLPEGLGEGANLDRVAQRRARAVGLQVAHGSGIDASALEYPADDVGLSIGVGDGVTISFATVVDGAACDHPVDLVAVSDGCNQRFE
jgi:hypothetical protein